jgi:hypothetical protein
MRPDLLIYRAILVNVIGFALLAIAALKGWIAELLAADVTDLVIVIFVVFLVGLAICAEKIITTSRRINRLLSASPDQPGPAGLYVDGPPELLAEALKSKLFSRIAVVRQFAAALVVLGLVGTVIGFIIALSGVTAEQASDVSGVRPMISTLVSGMSVALYTTLVGALLGLWLTINYRILSTGTATLYSELLTRKWKSLTTTAEPSSAT